VRRKTPAKTGTVMQKKKAEHKSPLHAGPGDAADQSYLPASKRMPAARQ
jgi:hypothetical protein